MSQLMTLTDSAAAHIKSLMAGAPAGEEFEGLRVGVTAAGCSGLSYSLEYAKEASPRSEERRVGKECKEACRSRWSTYH